MSKLSLARTMGICALSFEVTAFSAASPVEAQGSAGNIPGIEVRTLLVDRSTHREVEAIWLKTLTKERAGEAFVPGMARYAMLQLDCAVADDGRLKNCRARKDPDTPAMQAYYDKIISSFQLAPSVLNNRRPSALAVHIDVQTANSAGVEVFPYPCLPAFCTTTPPPPPPPGYKPEKGA